MSTNSEKNLKNLFVCFSFPYEKSVPACKTQNKQNEKEPSRSAESPFFFFLVLFPFFQNPKTNNLVASLGATLGPKEDASGRIEVGLLWQAFILVELSNEAGHTLLLLKTNEAEPSLS